MNGTLQNSGGGGGGSSNDIRVWLHSIGAGAYADAFVAQDISLDVVPLLSDAHLRELGVSTLGARLRLLAAARLLPHPTTSTSPISSTTSSSPSSPNTSRRSFETAPSPTPSSIISLANGVANHTTMIPVAATATTNGGDLFGAVDALLSAIQTLHTSLSHKQH